MKFVHTFTHNSFRGIDNKIYSFTFKTVWGPRWQSGNTLASHLCSRGSIPVMAVSGKAGSCLPLVGSLQYRTVANYMYWFPLPFQLPVVIWPVQCWKRRKTPNKQIKTVCGITLLIVKVFLPCFVSYALFRQQISARLNCYSRLQSKAFPHWMADEWMWTSEKSPLQYLNVLLRLNTYRKFW